jgi:hypothetical protein
VKRAFSGWFYWHMKYLKQGGGFANYNLDANPGSRYARRRDKMQSGALWDLDTTKAKLAPGLLRRMRAWVDSKERLVTARDARLEHSLPYPTLTAALEATTPDWRRWIEGAA